jgi:hypothetical protein
VAAQWREMAAGWFGSLGAERVAVEFADVQSVVSGDVAVVHAFVTYRSVAVDGRELRAMQNRLTWALEKHGEHWAIRHEHTSAPVALDYVEGDPQALARHFATRLRGDPRWPAQASAARWIHGRLRRNTCSARSPATCWAHS